MNNKEKLRNAGLRPTKQRMIVADILLNGFNRHFTAENLQDEINSSGNSMSIATVYNCLKKFKNCGLIKQVETSKDTAIFDTNTDYHHHFLNEETGELIDIENEEICLHKLPEIPQGYLNNGIEVIIKLKRHN
ncbi:transcriptional repressor [Alphaproteobacteria bacterium]|nr:transcriptional repressor [Alphaproteobacteria bacterium]